jgi:hypothetical protein
VEHWPVVSGPREAQERTEAVPPSNGSIDGAWQSLDGRDVILTSSQLSLFFADTLQALGGALNAKWVTDGKVEVGTFCNSQGWFTLSVGDGASHVSFFFVVAGVIQNVGETAVALFSLVSFYSQPLKL